MFKYLEEYYWNLVTSKSRDYMVFNIDTKGSKNPAEELGVKEEVLLLKALSGL